MMPTKMPNTTKHSHKIKHHIPRPQPVQIQTKDYHVCLDKSARANSFKVPLSQQAFNVTQRTIGVRLQRYNEQFQVESVLI